MNEEQRDQQLDAAFRRASAADGGRPDAKTRAAILAEAAAAARRRQPAANDSRYLLRAAAGIAVVGVALLIWRQTDHRVPGELPTMVVESAADAAAPLAAPPPEAAAGAPQLAEARADGQFVPEPPPASQPQDGPPAVGRASARAEVADAPAAKSTVEGESELDSVTVTASRLIQEQTAALPLVTQTPPPALLASDEADRRRVQSAPGANPDADEVGLEEVVVTGARIIRPPRAVGPRATPVPRGTGGSSQDAARERAEEQADVLALLRQHFPAQYQSNDPHRLWLVLDAAGAVRASGELASGQQLAGLAPQLERDLGRQVSADWRLHELRNQRGRTIELAVAVVP